MLIEGIFLRFLAKQNKLASDYYLIKQCYSSPVLTIVLMFASLVIKKSSL